MKKFVLIWRGGKFQGGGGERGKKYVCPSRRGVLLDSRGRSERERGLRLKSEHWEKGPFQSELKRSHPACLEERESH